MTTTISTNQLLAQMRAMASAAGQYEANQSTAVEGTTDFSNLLQTAIKDVNHDMRSAAAMKKDFVRGDRQTSLAEVMVASQKASVEFQLVLQVRNKLLSAYQDVMNMQI